MSSATCDVATSAMAGVSLTTPSSLSRPLGGRDERARVVGDDDEAVLPEVLERMLVEPVAEHLAGQLRQRGVRERHDVHPPLRRLLQLRHEALDLARPAADDQPLLGPGDEALGLLEQRA